MDLDRYIDSIMPANDKERRRLRQRLQEFSVLDSGTGIRQLCVPLGCGIPFREHLYYRSLLMSTALVQSLYHTTHEQAAVTVDEHGLLWLTMHMHDSAYDDDFWVYLPADSEDQAVEMYETSGININDLVRYVWQFDDWRWPVPRLQFNDGPWLYLVTNDLSLSLEEAFDQLVINNTLI